MAPATAMEAQLRAQLEHAGRALDAADRRGAPYAEVYRLVLRENALRAELERLAAPAAPGAVQ